MHRTALLLELLSGLRNVRSTLSLSEWWLVLSTMGALDARVIVLKLLHECTLGEIAERLDISPVVAHQRWKRACRELRTMNETLEVLLP